MGNEKIQDIKQFITQLKTLKCDLGTNLVDDSIEHWESRLLQLQVREIYDDNCDYFEKLPMMDVTFEVIQRLAMDSDKDFEKVYKSLWC